MFRYLTAAAAAVVFAAITVSAPNLAQAQQAQQVPCGERDKIRTKLGKDYAERPVSLGLSSNGTLIEVLASKSGSWTMIYTMPDGASCVVATGQSWEDIKPADGRPAA
jgi:hypothetical protein